MDKISRLIEDLLVTPLKQIIDDRGAVFHVLKNDSPQFDKFGEVYISKINPGIIKAWKCHKEMTQNLCVPFGQLKLVIYDERHNSNTYGLINEFYLDPDKNYNLVTIPKGLWYGFQCIGSEPALLLNVANMKHCPSESINESLEHSKIDYKW